jgi:hypothetical protein
VQVAQNWIIEFASERKAEGALYLFAELKRLAGSTVGVRHAPNRSRVNAILWADRAA